MWLVRRKGRPADRLLASSAPDLSRIAALIDTCSNDNAENKSILIGKQHVFQRNSQTSTISSNVRKSAALVSAEQPGRRGFLPSRRCESRPHLASLTNWTEVVPAQFRERCRTACEIRKKIWSMKAVTNYEAGQASDTMVKQIVRDSIPDGPASSSIGLHHTMRAWKVDTTTTTTRPTTTTSL